MKQIFYSMAQLKQKYISFSFKNLPCKPKRINNAAIILYLLQKEARQEKVLKIDPNCLLLSDKLFCFNRALYKTVCNPLFMINNLNHYNINHIANNLNCFDIKVYLTNKIHLTYKNLIYKQSIRLNHKLHNFKGKLQYNLTQNTHHYSLCSY